LEFIPKNSDYISSANSVTLWMQIMTTCVNMWGLIPNSCLKLGICMS
jgi:hypothetical protein